MKVQTPSQSLVEPPEDLVFAVGDVVELPVDRLHELPEEEGLAGALLPEHQDSRAGLGAQTLKGQSEPVEDVVGVSLGGAAEVEVKEVEQGLNDVQLPLVKRFFGDVGHREGAHTEIDLLGVPDVEVRVEEEALEGPLVGVCHPYLEGVAGVFGDLPRAAKRSPLVLGRPQLVVEVELDDFGLGEEDVGEEEVAVVDAESLEEFVALALVQLLHFGVVELDRELELR